MDVFPPSSLLDKVIRASAATYSSALLDNLGLKMTVNYPNNPIRSLGNSNIKVYPEIVLWRPDAPGSTSGSAEIVESIETELSIYDNFEKWRFLASLGIAFNLVIPETRYQKVKEILRDNEITGVKIQTYRFDEGENKIVFTNEEDI